MFERFTSSARTVVVGAQERARSHDQRFVATPHLLLGLLEGETGDLFRAHGVTPEAVEAALADLVRQAPGIAEDDAQMLAALGIDVEAIRAAVEANFGAGALDRPLPGPDRRPGLLGRLRGGDRPRDEVEALRRTAIGSGGHRPLSPAAKKTLELSLREALRLGDSEITVEHLALGLLRCSDGAAAVVLDRLGADSAAIRADLEGRRRRSA
jgi:ATP-dependent Clp protease ATP-binding subunit ClpA